MAKSDTVTISGAGDNDLNGATLQNAATERTLRDLVDVLNARKKGAGDKAEELRKKALEEGTEALEDLTDDQKAYMKEIVTSKKAVKDWTSSIAEATGVALGTTFSLISAAGSNLLTFLKDGFTSFQETSTVGASFNNDLIALRLAAAESAMPLQMFTESVKKNSQMLSVLGNTVTDGAQRFGILSKEFRNSDVGQQLMSMGFSVDELNSYLADQLEIDMRAGKLKGKSDAQLREQTANYLKQLDSLTKLTGLSREQIEQGMKTANRDGRLRAIQAKLQGKEAENFNANLGLLSASLDPGAMETMVNAMSGIIDPSDELGVALGSTYNDLLGFGKALSSGNLDPAGTIEQFRKMDQAITNRLQGLDAAVIAANPMFKRLSELQGEIQNLLNNNTEAALRQQKAQSEITKAFSIFGNTLNNIYGNVLSSLIESKVFQSLSEKLNDLAKIFNDNSSKISDFFGTLVSALDVSTGKFLEDIKSGKGLLPSFIDFFKDLFTNLSNAVAPLLQDIAVQSFGTDEQKKNQAMLSKMTPEERTQAIKENPSLAPPDLSQYVDGLKELVSFIPSMKDLALYLGVGVGGAVVAGAGLIAGFTALATGLAEISAPALLVGAALGMGGLGLGAALYGISTVIGSVSDSFVKLGAFFKTLSNDVNSEKVSGVAGAMKSLVSPVTDLVKAGIIGLVGAGGLGDLATSLAKFETINADKVSGIGPALIKLHEGLAPFTDRSFGDSITGFFSSSVSGNEIESLTNSLGKVQEISGSFQSASNGVEALTTSLSNLQNISGGIDRVKTVIGDNLLNDVKNVDSFTKSINNLVASLTKLEQQLKNNSTLTAKASVTSDNSGNTRVVSADTISGNSPDDIQKQLNIQVTELITHIVEMKQNTKDTADALSGRRSAI